MEAAQRPRVIGQAFADEHGNLAASRVPGRLHREARLADAGLARDEHDCAHSVVQGGDVLDEPAELRGPSGQGRPVEVTARRG